MSAEPDPRISQITEISGIRHFTYAVLAGTLAGGSIFLVITLPVGVGIAIEGRILRGLVVVFFPLAISGVGTLAGAVLVGLPVTAALRRCRRERAEYFTTIGILAGFLLPGMLLAAVESHGDTIVFASLFLGLFGSLAGMATGTVWGQWRESLHPASPGTTDKPANPFHEIIH